MRRERRRRRAAEAEARAHREVFESLQHFVNTRELAGIEPLPARVAVTSTAPGEGVSTVASGLAGMLAEEFLTPIVLVDLSWLGKAHRADPPATEPGITDVVSGEALLDDVLVETVDTNVFSLGKGSEDPNLVVPRSEDLDTVVDELWNSFEHIVLDMPPVLEGSAGLPLFRLADAYVLVIRSGLTRADDVARATRQLAEVPLAGSVLTRQRTRVPASLQRLSGE